MADVRSMLRTGSNSRASAGVGLAPRTTPFMHQWKMPTRCSAFGCIGVPALQP